MAHILIGRYRSLTEAEAIVHDLVAQGFPRSQMTLATPHATVPASAHLGLQTWSALEGAQDLERRFLDLGVPDNEVRTYTEAVRQGETLVVVQASAEQAERGLDILHGQRQVSARQSAPNGSTWAMWGWSPMVTLRAIGRQGPSTRQAWLAPRRPSASIRRRRRRRAA